MGGGGQYPYPKQVWSPAGGWWSRPSNWRSNTAIAFGGILFVCYCTWQLSAAREWRHSPPTKFIPSMLWEKQYAYANQKASIEKGEEGKTLQ